MTKSNVRAARSILEAFAADVRQAQTRDEFEGILDRWLASGFPEAEAYRGDFNRRGEIVGEVTKSLRALDGDGQAFAQAERDRLPVFRGAQRVREAAAQGTVEAMPPDQRPHAVARGAGEHEPEDRQKDRSELQRANDFLKQLDAFGGFGRHIPDAVQPTVNDGAHRVAYIWEDEPARFEINENPHASGEMVWYEQPLRGALATFDHEEQIARAADKYAVDPDLIRAVMWAEASRGHKLGANKIADILRLSSSHLPMNIQGEKWARLIGTVPSALRDPESNIEAAAALLRRISDRIDDPTPEKIGPIWNYAGREDVNDFGASIGRLCSERPWLSREPEDPSGGPPLPP